MARRTRISEITKDKSPRNRPANAITQANWQGVNYVDAPIAMKPEQVPFAQNVDFGYPIGSASKVRGRENLFTSLGAGGCKGIHTFKHSSGDILLYAHGTSLYKVSGDSQIYSYSTSEDFAAGTTENISQTGSEPVFLNNYMISGSEPSSLQLEGGTAYTNTVTAVADFAGTHDGTEAVTDDILGDVLQLGQADYQYGIKTQLSIIEAAAVTYTSTGGYYGYRFDVDTGPIVVQGLRVWIPTAGVWSCGIACSNVDVATLSVTTTADGEWAEALFASPVSLAVDSSYFIWINIPSGTQYYGYNPTDESTELYTGISNVSGVRASVDKWGRSPFLSSYLLGMIDFVVTAAEGIINTEGTYTHTVQNLSTVKWVDAATITWNDYVQAGTTLNIYTRVSTDAGLTYGDWTLRASGDTIFSQFTDISNYRIQWKAYLATTDLTKNPQLEDLTIALTPSYQSAGGTYTSEVIDMDNTPKTASLSWVTTLPSGTSIEWDVRGSSDNVVWGDWEVISISGGGIPLTRYIQVKALLYGTTNKTPSITSYTLTTTFDYNTATVIKTGLSGNRVRFQDYDDRCYCADGGRPQIVYVDAGGVTQIRDAGVDPPSAAPTTAAGEGTGLTGAYLSKYTFVNTDGTESNPSAASDSLTVSNKDIVWTVAAGPTGTASRKLYRTKAGGAVYYYVAEIEDNTTTSYTDTVADSALTVAMDDELWIPPDADIVYTFMNYMMYVYADNPTQLYISVVGSPEQTNNVYKQFPGKILGIGATHNAVVVHGESFVAQITASDSGFIFDNDPTVDTTTVRYIDSAGAMSHESIAICIDSAARQIMVFPSPTGVRYLVPGYQDYSLESVPLSRNIQPYFNDAVSRENMAGVFYRDYYLLAFTYQDPTKAAVTTNNVIFAYDFRVQQWYGPWVFNVNNFTIVNNDLYCGDSVLGKAYKMFSGSSDDGDAINMILDLPSAAPGGLQNTCKFRRFLMVVSSDSITTSTNVKPKINDQQATVSIGALTSSYTGDTRPGDKFVRSRKYPIPLTPGNSISYRIEDNSVNPLSIQQLITEFEVLGIKR